jgi:predicted DNA-binding transcriptional regulator AlpA
MLITTPEVAAKLGYSLSYFRKRWRRWRRELGFPAPSIGFKWETDAIDTWLRERSARRPDAIDRTAPERSPPGRPRSLDVDTRQRQANRQLDRA